MGATEPNAAPSSADTDRTVLRAVRQLRLWRAVRPEARHLAVPAAVLIQAGFAATLPTPIGRLVILNRQGLRLIGRGAHLVSEQSAATSVYLQDAQAALKEQGFSRLRPGEGPYFVVDNRAGRPCPVIGHYRREGYEKRIIARHLAELESELRLNRAQLVLVHPGQRPAFAHTHLYPIFSPPLWLQVQ